MLEYGGVSEIRKSPADALNEGTTGGRAAALSLREIKNTCICCMFELKCQYQ